LVFRELDSYELDLVSGGGAVFLNGETGERSCVDPNETLYSSSNGDSTLYWCGTGGS
jgi:hypothetical protein